MYKCLVVCINVCSPHVFASHSWNYILCTHCTVLYTTHYTLYTEQCTVNSAQDILHTEHYTLPTVHWTLHTAHYTLYIAHCSLYTALCTVRVQTLNSRAEYGRDLQLFLVCTVLYSTLLNSALYPISTVQCTELRYATLQCRSTGVKEFYNYRSTGLQECMSVGVHECRTRWA